MPAGRGRSGMGVGRGRRAVVGALVGALAGAVLTVAVAGPAAAKGPERVTITPPGGDPVEVSIALPPDDADSSDGEVGRPVGEEPNEPDPRFARLTEALGIWEVTGVGGAVLPEAPPGDLGPELAAEWTMYNPVPANPDAAPYGPWDGSLGLDALAAAVRDVAGVKRVVVDVPAADVDANDPAFPDDGEIGLLVPGNILVRRKW